MCLRAVLPWLAAVTLDWWLSVDERLTDIDELYCISTDETNATATAGCFFVWSHVTTRNYYSHVILLLTLLSSEPVVDSAAALSTGLPSSSSSSFPRSCVRLSMRHSTPAAAERCNKEVYQSFDRLWIVCNENEYSPFRSRRTNRTQASGSARILYWQ